MFTFRKIVFFAVFVAALVFMVRQWRAPANDMKEAQAKYEVWSCTTHKDLKFSSPGKCSMCGLDLVKSEE